MSIPGKQPCIFSHTLWDTGSFTLYATKVYTGSDNTHPNYYNAHWSSSVLTHSCVISSIDVLMSFTLSSHSYTLCFMFLFVTLFSHLQITEKVLQWRKISLSFYILFWTHLFLKIVLQIMVYFYASSEYNSQTTLYLFCSFNFLAYKYYQVI